MRRRIGWLAVLIAVVVAGVFTLPSLSLHGFGHLRAEACQDPEVHPCP